MRLSLRLFLPVLAALMLAWPTGASAASAPPGFRFFAPDSIWNKPLRDDVAIRPDSTDMVRFLRTSVSLNGAYVNSVQCGMPIYWADPSTPRVRVELDHAYKDPALIRAWSAVPIPAEAAPSNCSDLNFAVAQQQPEGTVTLWEFWKATKRPDGTWVAGWGGVTQDAANDRGFASSYSWRDPLAPTHLERSSNPLWHVTASSASMVGGVVTAEELQAGIIDHALAFAVTDAARGRWLWPAQRSDGGIDDPAAVPEGAQLRIDPAVDLSKLQMTPLVRMLAVAAQRYGIVVRDRSFSANLFYVEEPHRGQPDPVVGLLDGKPRWLALRAFPWDKLQVVDAPTCTRYTGCFAKPSAVIDVDARSSSAASAGVAVTLDTSNSTLDQPRRRVRWDLDDDGSFETDGGTACSIMFTPRGAGTTTVRVQITTRDGATVTGARTLEVGPGTEPAPASGAAHAPSAGDGRVAQAPPVSQRPTTGCDDGRAAGAVPRFLGRRPGIRVTGPARRRVPAGGRIRVVAQAVNAGACRYVEVQRRVRGANRWHRTHLLRLRGSGHIAWTGRAGGRRVSVRLRLLERRNGGVVATSRVVLVRTHSGR